MSTAPRYKSDGPRSLVGLALALLVVGARIQRALVQLDAGATPAPCSLASHGLLRISLPMRFWSCSLDLVFELLLVAGNAYLVIAFLLPAQLSLSPSAED